MNFLLIVPAWTWLILSALWFAGGEYLSKRWGIQPSWGLAMIVVGVYAIGSLVWLPALLHRNQLAIMGTLWLVLAAIATVSVGLLVFGERLNIFQWAGVGLGLLALVLLNL